MIVLDASATIEWLLRTPAGIKVDRRLFAHPLAPCAPHLIDVEVAQVLRRYVGAGAMTAQRGEEALADLADLAINRYPHDVLIPRVWQLRATLTAYDAAYVALAELLDAPLLTCDRRIGAAAGHRAAIDLV